MPITLSSSSNCSAIVVHTAVVAGCICLASSADRVVFVLSIQPSYCINSFLSPYKLLYQFISLLIQNVYYKILIFFTITLTLNDTKFFLSCVCAFSNRSKWVGYSRWESLWMSLFSLVYVVVCLNLNHVTLVFFSQPSALQQHSTTSSPKSHQLSLSVITII
jgi:hypothetical protein